jgi:sensor histidine kinase YesM
MITLDQDQPTASPARFGKEMTVCLAYTALFNTAIALLLWAVGFGGTFFQTLVVSQCIGLSICTTVIIGLWMANPVGRVSRVLVVVGAIGAGSLFGTLTGAGLVMDSPLALIRQTDFFLRIVGLGMLFGGVVGYFFYSRHQLESSAALVQKERIRRLSSEKLALTAELKRLQAQIEPHFLFNTLSTVHSLMDSDIELAKAMQLNLIRYLRTSLKRTRNQTTTLGQEGDLMKAYLDIYKIRMGARLAYSIAIPEELASAELPPLLLQPLVENALVHGLEPKTEGGTLSVAASCVGDRLRIEISDTGAGLSTRQPPGIGLTNVSRRLEKLYGDQARMRVKHRQPTGVAVTIEMPLSQ